MLGVYVHIPFCARLCDYCAFATWSDRGGLIDDYMVALDRQARSAELTGVSSVFVGGGTPSLVPGDSLVQVLGRLELVEGAEVTVECNPDSVTPALMATYAAGGVNRLSLGAQSMVDRVLASLGRTHRVDNVAQAVESARAAGIAQVNLDLIYGAAGETVEDWRQTLERVIDLGPDHISAYALTIEPGTPLARDPARHPDDDDQADKYLLADDVLTAAGYVNYEISNWSRPGAECRHNLLYWRQGDYVGLGCAAHSHQGGRRYWSVRTPERFISLISQDRSVEAGSESLDAHERRIEGLQLSLRTRDGVRADELPPGVEHLVDVGADGLARLTREGRLLANEIAIRFV